MREVRNWAGLSLLGFLAGCGAEAPGHALPVAYDSAGVRVVETSVPVWAEGEGWRVGEQPLLEIGVVDGDPHYQFSRITGAARLSDGRVVVLDVDAMEIRYFDDEGRHLTTVGRRGDGPGEFRDLSLVGIVPGDSVVVWDRGHARLSVLGPDGAFARYANLRPEHGGVHPYVYGLYPDGSLLASFPTVMSRQPSHGEVVQDSARFWHFDYGTGTRRRLVSFPSHETLFWHGLPYQEPTFFSMAPRWALHGSELFTTRGAEHAVDVYGPDGTLRLRMRHLRDPVPVSGADVEFARQIVQRSVQRAAVDPAGAIERLPIREHRRAFDELLVDPEGNVWARPLRMPGDADLDAPTQWSVYRSDGALLGNVAIPSMIRVLQVDRDLLLAVRYDDLGVPFIALYPILSTPNES